MIQEQAINSERTAQPSSRALKLRRTGRKPGLLLSLSTLLYGLALLAVSIANLIGPERWWIGSANLYVPQWIWALPCILILPWYLLRAWRWCWVPIAMAAWVFGPVMGWSFGLARLAPAPAGAHLRVMTYNVKWGTRGATAVMTNVAAADPDILIMQDAMGAVDNVLARLKKPGLYVVRFMQFTVLSKYPITDVLYNTSVPVRRYHTFLRCTIHVQGQSITLYDAHLMTPRYALGSLADNGTEGAGDLQQNARVRLQEAVTLAEHVRTANGPVIVAGDLNAPVQSRVCRALTDGGLRDAFSEAGWGYGYTYGQSTALKRPFVRIDHILLSPEWAVVNCREGRARGSDHSPVIADLILPAR